jgi:hypothetical protein
MIRPILTRFVVALLVMSNARADGGTSAVAQQSTQVTESPLVLLLQRKLEALEARLERAENSMLDTQSHAQQSDSRVDQLEFTVQRLLEQKNSNESTAAPLLQPPPPPPPPPLPDYTRPVIADVRGTGDERSVSGSLRSRKQSPGSTTCPLASLQNHLVEIANVCCPGNDCSATQYPPANGTCNAQCAAVVEPFWDSCSNLLGALNMLPTGFDQFYINCMLTLYPPGDCGSQCTQSTYHCRVMEVNQACCSDPLNCPANLATPLQCPIGCALVFPAFVSDCGAAHILTNAEVSQFQSFVDGCLRADPAELVEYAQGLVEQNCTVNLPTVTGPPLQHLPPSVPMFQSDPWITNIHDSSTCLTFSEVRSRVSEAHRICCRPGGACQDAHGEIAFPTSCTPECALAFHDLRHDCGFLLNFSLPVDTLEEWDQFDQLCLAQSTVDTAGFLVALHNASCCTAGQCGCATAQSCAAVAFDSVQGGCSWDTSTSSCQVLPVGGAAFTGGQILTPAMYAQLSAWIHQKGLSSTGGWQLCYSSPNGDPRNAPSAWHSRCDGHPRTVVVGSFNGVTFGGYHSGSWRSVGGCQHDGTASDDFLFQLAPNPALFELRSGSCNVYDSSGYWPTFGGSHDICFGRNSVLGRNGYCNSGQRGNTYAGTYSRCACGADSVHCSSSSTRNSSYTWNRRYTQVQLEVWYAL